MTTPHGSAQPVEIDTSQPSPARVYDYVLGGTHNYKVDRDAAEAIRAVEPSSFESVVENRGFLVRAVRFLAARGIEQFLDVGSGLPTAQNVHEVATDARVAYVDNDPTVWTEARGLLAGAERRTAFVCADVREPGSILGHPDLSLLDFTKPVGLLLVAVLHFVRDEERPAELVEALAERLVPGSFLVISHVTDEDIAPELKASLDRQYGNAPAPLILRSREGIRELFGGRELVEPGLVDITQWRPEEPRDRLNLRLLCGVTEIG